MGKHGAGARHPHRTGAAENSISSRNGEITKQIPSWSLRSAASRPAGSDQRTRERSYTATTQQDAHAEHRPAGGVDIAPVDRELVRAHDREDHPAWANHEFTGLRENRRQYRAMIPYVANAFECRRKIDQVARTQWGRRLGVGLREVHPPNKNR